MILETQKRKDFRCKIRIRHFQKDWINSRNEEEDLLITLGLLFARALSEELNVERTDLDLPLRLMDIFVFLMLILVVPAILTSWLLWT